MATRRSLGGGRVLGNGHNLSAEPSLAQVAHKRALHIANTGLLSPSDSSVSLDSQISVTPLSSQDEDLAARVALRSDHPVPNTRANPSLVCPICAEEMVTLLQLNRHLDDNHRNLEEGEQYEVQNWFEQQVQKAKKFQPLAVLNQRLRGLDVFEPNSAAASPPSTSAGRPSSRQGSPAPEHRSIDPDEVVQRTHWQRPSGHDLCADPACGRSLGSTNGQINCRHCGKLFCDEHTMYQMRLSRTAQHEPVRGLWCRVCETCYKSREGYNDHAGCERTITNEFLSARKRVVDKATLDVSRLEKRLTKLTQLLADPPGHDTSQSGASGFFWSMAGSKNHLRALEQSVVAWQDDASVSQCPFCHQSFTQYSFRRHHCRICGRVVCADLETGCSTEVALQADVSGDNEKHDGPQIPLDIRMCKDCNTTLFARADFDREASSFPESSQRAFQNLDQFEAGIRLLLPKYQRLLHVLQTPDPPPTHSQLAEATKIRKRLTEAFTRYDAAARRVRDMPTENATQARLNKAVHAQSAAFLHTHMLPLKQVPKILRSGAAVRPSGLAGLQIDVGRRDSSESAASTLDTAAVSALETEEKELRERLIVLEEQLFLVQGMLDTAKKKRRFDEAAALSGNVDDLNREINGIQAQLSGLDWNGAYGV